jgi:ABC-type nickel/cobalt efflux system permease component RcnA
MTANSRQTKTEKPTMRRRLKNAALILISQMLLVALAVAWLVHMSLIAAYGSIFFIEDNPFILWGEIIASALIIIFAVFVLVNQIKRLGERRSADRERDNRNPRVDGSRMTSRRWTDDNISSLKGETVPGLSHSELSTDSETTNQVLRSQKEIH